MRPPAAEPGGGSARPPGLPPPPPGAPPVAGPLGQPEHGLGTLTLLAGRGAPAEIGPYSGVAWAASVFPVRAGHNVIDWVNLDIAAAIEHALDKGAHVILVCMGGLPGFRIARAVDRAYQLGVPIVAAVGNHFSVAGAPVGPRRVACPAAYPQTIAVSGVQANGDPYNRRSLPGCQMSGNRGPEVDLCAPSPCVPWVRPVGGATLLQPGEGTSAAAPQVAGSAAILLARFANELPQRGDDDAWRRVEFVRAALTGTANAAACNGHTQKRDWFGAGRLQLDRAIQVNPQALLAGLARRERTSHWASFRAMLQPNVDSLPLFGFDAARYAELYAAFVAAEVNAGDAVDGRGAGAAPVHEDRLCTRAHTLGDGGSAAVPTLGDGGSAADPTLRARGQPGDRP